MTDRKLHILGSPGFLIGLLLLLTNDFVFKQQFHNGFTGKLSDFAGLFVFSLFWIAFFPRHKRLICISTAVLFVFWKSAYSQFVIEGWNSLAFFGIQRTVDYSDLWALLIVPLSYFYSGVSAEVHVPRRLVHAIAIVSVVAFTATSYRHKASFNNQYQFETSRKQLLERISRLPRENVNDSFWNGGGAFEVRFDDCISRADIALEERENRTVVALKEMEYRCPSKPDPDEMRLHFEKEFIDKIREDPVVRSTEVTDVWSTSLPTPTPTPTPST
jgi:hypothetical protein